MELAFRSAARLSPGVRLAQAISQFEASLADREKADFKTLKSQARNLTPGVQDVMIVTAELNKRATRAGIGARFTNMLMAVQQFATIGDVVIGGSQSLPACGVWCVVRSSLTLLIGFSSHLERFSSLFMDIGRSSPRYQDLALLYSCSDKIRRDLVEYFIVVVNICQQFVEFSKKSKLVQLTTSAFDTRLRKAESDLKQYAAYIKEEVETLNTRTIVYESQENSRMRALIDRKHHTRKLQQKLKRRSDYLSACTDYDHETPWKRARKRGDTSWFVTEQAYLEFKSCEASSALVLSGKLGSGKTVLTANLVDDLILFGRGTVCYFFISHDIAKSCQSETIFRSLCRQMIAFHASNDVLDELCTEDSPVLDEKAVLTLLRRVLDSLNGHIYFILDGIDDCDHGETQNIMTTLRDLIDYSKSSTLHVCVSLRTQADEVQSKYRGLNPERLLSMPEENPDILSYVDAQLATRIENEQLLFGDPTIVVEIQDALLEGAQGMFLWVVLQLDGLCKNDIGTDESIRRSLRDMPKDLDALFSRILQRANVSGPAFQNRLLKVLVAAQRPLTVDEVRETLSIVPADATWRPQQQINDITNALASCGSLVTVDEEEATVSFIHQSVPQFLVQGAENDDLSEWHFTSDEASLELGQLLVTYLSYGVFDQQLSTLVVPNVSASQATTAVIQHVLEENSWRKATALKLLRLWSQRDADLGRAITEVSGAYQRSSETQDVFHLLAYAREYWLYHTRSISSDSSTFWLWKDLLTHPKFGNEMQIASLGNSFTTPEDSLINRWLMQPPAKRHYEIMISRSEGYWTDVNNPNQRYIVCRSHPKILWAITNSHLGCLSLELKGKQGLKAMCGVVIYLLALRRSHSRPKLDRSMWEKLGRCADAVRMKDISYHIFQLCQSGGGRLMAQYNLQDLHQVEKRLVEEQRKAISPRGTGPEKFRRLRELSMAAVFEEKNNKPY